MENKHTPGPWSVSDRFGLLDIVGDGTTPCRVDGRPATVAECFNTPAVNTGRPTPAEARANARLIAAAPDLLAALEDMEEYYSRLTVADDDGNRSDLTDILSDCVDAARAAIARARGE